MEGDILIGSGKVQSQPYSMDGHLGKIWQAGRVWMEHRTLGYG